MAYLLTEANVDRLLDALKNAHARAIASPYWPMAKGQREVMEIINAADSLEKEVRRNREIAPNVTNVPTPTGSTHIVGRAYDCRSEEKPK